jgi:acyl-coenzyme A synthetase/AMP-(fatty) acid ligase
MMSTGAPLPHEERVAIRRRLTPNLVDAYGATAASLATVIHPDEQDRHPGSVGRPILDVDLQIVDADDRPVRQGETGRVRYRTPALPLGFVGSVAAGEEDIRDGWFYPGDYGTLDRDGYLHLKGRRSEIVVRGGVNVFTPEVERVLAAHPAVLEAAVVGVPSAEHGEDLIAFVRCGAPTEPRSLVQHCRAALAAYKIPREFRFVEALPRNSGGKVAKAQLAQGAGLRLSSEVVLVEEERRRR